MKLDSRYGERVTEEWQRKKLAELLVSLADEDRRLFDRLYAHGVPADHLAYALTLVNTMLMEGRA